jgi:hypothetical protein
MHHPRNPTRPRRLSTLLVALPLVLAGCSQNPPAAPADRAAEPTATVPADATVGPPAPRTRRRPRPSSSALAQLGRLRTAPETHAAGYQREFFALWRVRGGCDTREEVLRGEARAGRPAGCTVAGGRWRSAYDGRTTRDPSSFDIDHMVPFKQAWVSGAWRWSAGTRERFANDLGYAGSLRAVSAASNRSKGDADPARWLPPRVSFRCRYVGTWIAVKYRWRLSVDAGERRVLRRWAVRCGRRAVVAPVHRTRVRLSAGRRTAAGRPSGGHGERRYATCAQVKAHGLGPYRRGRDREYDWYRDADDDGLVCE